MTKTTVEGDERMKTRKEMMVYEMNNDASPVSMGPVPLGLRDV